MPLHPAENRGSRELFLTAREAETRLNRLAEALDAEAARPVARAAELLGDLVVELRSVLARHDLYSELAAEGSGARIGTVRGAILDRFLERNQALRFAVDDLEHATTLLAYLAVVSETRGDEQLPELCRSWERRMRRQVSAVRGAALALAADPDTAIEPLDTSPVGQVAHKSAVVAGTVGEWIDRRFARHRRT
jgi:hypothetical protein